MLLQYGYKLYYCINSLLYSCCLYFEGFSIHFFPTSYLDCTCIVKRIGIDIDLVNDNKYWTILINNATKECSINPIHKAHLIWSNKNTTPLMELQNFM